MADGWELSVILCAEPYTAERQEDPYGKQICSSIFARTSRSAFVRTCSDDCAGIGRFDRRSQESVSRAHAWCRDGCPSARRGRISLGNHRNGSSTKTVLTPDGAFELSIPRDRPGRFDPALIAKYRRRFPGFDKKIIASYAWGMSTRDIQAHVSELYGIEVSPNLVSTVTGLGDRRSDGLVGPATRGDLCGRLLRCLARRDP